MNIRIFRSLDCPQELLVDVVNLLNHYDGPLKFVAEQEAHSFSAFQDPPENPYEKVIISKSARPIPFFETRFRTRKTVDWTEIFGMCSRLRQQHDIGADEFVVLLMAFNNTRNWFAAGSPDAQCNFFVHTEDWDFFIGSDQRFPVAYQIASGIVKKLVFNDLSDLNDHWHEKSRACMMDFCSKKEEVKLKMRTADVCTDCLELFEKRGLSPVIFDQVLRILDGIRGQMLLKSRFRFQQKIPVLHIRSRQYNLVIPEMAQLTIHLDHMEKALYLFYLAHPEGIAMSHLPDFSGEILEWYRKISPTEDLHRMEERILKLTNPMENTASEKLSRMKRKFFQALGPEIASHYIIDGLNGRAKKISLDRNLVVFEDQ